MRPKSRFCQSYFLFVSLLTVLLFSTGCLQRTITITSEPAGAIVHLNDQEIGRTPVTTGFTFYGDYDVRLDHDAAEPLWTHRKLHTPFWDIPGIDLIAEAIPGRRTYNVDWHFKLTPSKPLSQTDRDKLLLSANEMRIQLIEKESPSEILRKRHEAEQIRQEKALLEQKTPRPVKRP